MRTAMHNINGIITVYKEKGYTSHDVVAKLRGIVRQKKIGHTGTLDPNAEGVLPVCLGTGTRLCEMFTEHDKVYRAVLLLGQETDTQDITGRVCCQAPVEEWISQGRLAEETVVSCISSFVGEQLQTPPMYSAKKIQGKKLYELARAGVEIERQPVPVTIYDIQIEAVQLPRVTMRIHCGKGTYIRTLCTDIGRRLGCYGTMAALTRLSVGDFRIEEAWRLRELEALAREGRISQAVTPVERFFAALSEARTLPAFDRAVHNGNPCPPDWFENWEPKDGAWPKAIRVCDSAGIFIGSYRYAASRGIYVPDKIFYRPQTAPDTKKSPDTKPVSIQPNRNER